MAYIESDKILTHLKSKWHGKNCPMCDSGGWNVSDRVYELREYHGGNMVIGGSPIVPVIPITCDNCGNTVLINSLVAGVTEQEKGASDE